MNKIIVASLFVFMSLTIGCQKNNGTLPLIEALMNRWLSVHTVVDLTQGLISGEQGGQQEIARPPNAWIPLLEVKRWNKKGEARDCLLFKTPFKKQLGTLKLVELRAAEDSCAALPDPEGELAIAQFEQLEALWIKFKDSTIDLKFRIQGKESDYKILLYNVEKTKKYQLYANPLSERLIPGLIVLTDGAAYPVVPRMGELSDRYGDQSAKLCHQVDQNCISLTSNQCAQCRYGWYSLPHNSCPQGGTKICGVNRCGNQGEPACPRGLQYRSYKMEFACIDDSNAAFCQQGLRVMCDGKRNLICQ